MKKHSIKSTVIVLGIYSLLSWSLFASTLSGKGIGNTLATLGLYVLATATLFYLLSATASTVASHTSSQATTRLYSRAGQSNALLPISLGTIYALAIYALGRVLAIWQASTSMSSSLLPASITSALNSPRFYLITVVCACALYTFISSHKALLLVGTSKSETPRIAIKKATAFLKEIGRYCLYRICICIPVALVVWVLLYFLEKPSANSVAYVSLFATSIPAIGWILACFVIFPALLNTYGILSAIRACLAICLSYLLLSSLFSKRFKEYTKSLFQIVLVTILSFALLGSDFALISGCLYLGIASLITSKTARKRQTSSAI
ncbi:MAG: hypothetical protein IKV30_06425 [Clostridia bacterium]|nr:hypothetical protein [Clostridia bacterium]